MSFLFFDINLDIKILVSLWVFATLFYYLIIKGNLNLLKLNIRTQWYIFKYYWRNDKFCLFIKLFIARLFVLIFYYLLYYVLTKFDAYYPIICIISFLKLSIFSPFFIIKEINEKLYMNTLIFSLVPGGSTYNTDANIYNSMRLGSILNPSNPGPSVGSSAITNTSTPSASNYISSSNTVSTNNPITSSNTVSTNNPHVNTASNVNISGRANAVASSMTNSENTSGYKAINIGKDKASSSGISTQSNIAANTTNISTNTPESMGEKVLNILKNQDTYRRSIKKGHMNIYNEKFPNECLLDKESRDFLHNIFKNDDRFSIITVRGGGPNSIWRMTEKGEYPIATKTLIKYIESRIK